MTHRAHTQLWAPTFAATGGGIAAFSRELAYALHEIDTAGEPRLFSKLDHSMLLRQLEITGAGSLPAFAQAPGLFAAALAGCLRAGPRLIVSSHLNFGPAARLLRKLFGIRYVLVAHGIDAHPRLSNQRLCALREADAVWVVSQWTKQRVMALGVPESRISVLPNTVPERTFEPGARDPALMQRYGIAADEKVILTVARLDAQEGYKGYDKVLRALPAVIRAVGKVRHLVVGKGGDAERLKALARDLGLEDRLTLCGFVPDASLAAHYRLADVFAMPSLGEGFGIVFLEAMASGVPVLGGNRDGTVDALAGGELGSLVDPEDIEDLGAALVDLLQGRGPAWWFEPDALRAECLRRFGHGAFLQHLRAALAAISKRND
jgi:phosphatidyl-myo-inositol dimannoside synthase